MQCMIHTPGNSVLVGGHQSAVFELDTNTLAPINKVPDLLDTVRLKITDYFKKITDYYKKITDYFENITDYLKKDN